MITKEKLIDLRRRMQRHGEAEGVAVVVVTARELEELLRIAEHVVEDQKSDKKLVDGFYWIEWLDGPVIAGRTTEGVIDGEERICWNTCGSDDYFIGDDKITVVAGPLKPPFEAEAEEAPEQRFVAAREGDVFLPTNYARGSPAVDLAAARPYERGCVIRGGSELIPAIRQPDGSVVVLETSTNSTSAVTETQK